MLGHNNGWESTVQHLCGVHVEMTTANAVLLEGKGSWKKLARADSCTFIEVLRPREL